MSGYLDLQIPVKVIHDLDEALVVKHTDLQLIEEGKYSLLGLAVKLHNFVNLRIEFVEGYEPVLIFVEQVEGIKGGNLASV